MTCIDHAKPDRTRRSRPSSYLTSCLNESLHVSSQIWLTFAPVANQSAQHLKVGLEEINWLSLVYMVVAIPLSFGTTWMLDTFGLRITVRSVRYLAVLFLYSVNNIVFYDNNTKLTKLF